MKLSKNSKKLMSFFTNNSYIKPASHNKETDETIRILHNEILKGYNYVKLLNKVGNYYNVSTKQSQCGIDYFTYIYCWALKPSSTTWK